MTTIFLRVFDGAQIAGQSVADIARDLTLAHLASSRPLRYRHPAPPDPMAQPNRKPPMTTIYIDADACPVKAEAERVATRLHVPMVLVCNGGLRIPQNPFVSLVIVEEGPDIADRWIAERCGPADVVVTADLPLADACLKAGARVLQHDGTALTPANIGPRLATRDLMQDIRAADPFHRGSGAGFGKADRARFLQQLDHTVQQALRQLKGG